jgi:hypothetical protein
LEKFGRDGGHRSAAPPVAGSVFMNSFLITGYPHVSH